MLSMSTYSTVGGLLLLLVSGACQILVDHHEYEELTFNHLTKAIGSEPGQINKLGFRNLLQTLKARIGCKPDMPCFQKLSVNNLVGETEIFTEETFLPVAKNILHLLTNNDACSTESKLNSTIFSNRLCRNDVKATLKTLETKYERSQDECFGPFTLLNSECTSHTDDVIYALLANLYDGNCILPASQDVIQELLDHTGAVNDVISDAAFQNLLKDLGIAVSVTPKNQHSNHEHKRKKRSVDDAHADTAMCYSEKHLRSIFGYFGDINRTQLLEMCPVFMQQIAEGACKKEASANETSTGASGPTYTEAMKYGYATAAVTIISALAFVGMIFFPVIGTPTFRLVMQFFIALGVGTMSGDAIFHIIPEVVGLHNHDDHNEAEESGIHVEEYVWKFVVVVAGIWLLFVFENTLKLMSKGKMVHSHNAMPADITYNRHAEAHSQVTKFTSIDETKASGPAQVTELDEVKGTSCDNSDEKQSDISEKTQTLETDKGYFWGITSTGILILVGDILHNFGDGIAIGAAFSESSTDGIGTSLAIIFHELPHEFGDFAIYLNNGLTKWRALALNFLAACFCYVGLYVGIALSEDEQIRIWLLAFVAGMFLYISLVNVLHELVEEETDQPKLQFAMQNLGLVAGWGALLALSIFEEPLIESIQ